MANKFFKKTNKKDNIFKVVPKKDIDSSENTKIPIDENIEENINERAIEDLRELVADNENLNDVINNNLDNIGKHIDALTDSINKIIPANGSLNRHLKMIFDFSSCNFDPQKRNNPLSYFTPNFFKYVIPIVRNSTNFDKDLTPNDIFNSSSDRVKDIITKANNDANKNIAFILSFISTIGVYFFTIGFNILKVIFPCWIIKLLDNALRETSGGFIYTGVCADDNSGRNRDDENLYDRAERFDPTTLPLNQDFLNQYEKAVNEISNGNNGIWNGCTDEPAINSLGEIAVPTEEQIGALREILDYLADRTDLINRMKNALHLETSLKKIQSEAGLSLDIARCMNEEYVRYTDIEDFNNLVKNPSGKLPFLGFSQTITKLDVNEVNSSNNLTLQTILSINTRLREVTNEIKKTNNLVGNYFNSNITYRTLNKLQKNQRNQLITKISIDIVCCIVRIVIQRILRGDINNVDPKGSSFRDFISLINKVKESKETRQRLLNEGVLSDYLIKHNDFLEGVVNSQLSLILTNEIVNTVYAFKEGGSALESSIRIYPFGNFAVAILDGLRNNSLKLVLSTIKSLFDLAINKLDMAFRKHTNLGLNDCSSLKFSIDALSQLVKVVLNVIRKFINNKKEINNKIGIEINFSLKSHHQSFIRDIILSALFILNNFFDVILISCLGFDDDTEFREILSNINSKSMEEQNKKQSLNGNNNDNPLPNIDFENEDLDIDDPSEEMETFDDVDDSNIESYFTDSGEYNIKTIINKSANDLFNNEGIANINPFLQSISTIDFNNIDDIDSNTIKIIHENFRNRFVNEDIKNII